jgi:C4-type Zn-finger protein
MHELTDDQVQHIHHKLDLSGLCPICGTENPWVLDDSLVLLTQLAHQRPLPLVAVICEECGYVCLFDADKLGI